MVRRGAEWRFMDEVRDREDAKDGEGTPDGKTSWPLCGLTHSPWEVRFLGCWCYRNSKNK